MLVTATVLETAGLNAVRTSQSLLAREAGGDDHSFAPVLEVRLGLGDSGCLGLLQAVGPVLEEDLDDIGSPVARHLLIRTLLQGVGAGELVAKPRSQ